MVMPVAFRKREHKRSEASAQQRAKTLLSEQ